MTREEQEVQSKPPSQPVKLDPVPSFRVSADTISPPTNLAGAFVLLDDQAVMRGRLFHAWFEQIEWADDQLPPVSVLRDAAARIGRFDRTALDRELDRFVSLVRTGELGRLLRRSHYRDLTDSGATLRVLRERRFTVQDASLIETPSFVTGQFDRCVVALQDGRPEFAEVLDFKTDTITAEDPGLVRLLNRYHDQLTAYRSGAATLFSLPPDRIRCTLVSTSTDRWISI